MLAKANDELPPLLSSITLTAEDSWEADIPSSQLSRGKQKSVWDPSYTHVHVFRHTTPPQKNCQCNRGADHISAAGRAGQPAEVMLSPGHLLKVKVREIIPTLLTGAGTLTCWETE